MSEEKRNDAPSSTGADKDKSAASASKPDQTSGTPSKTSSAASSGAASAPATDPAPAKAADKNTASGGKSKSGPSKNAAGSGKGSAKPASTGGTGKPASKPADKSSASKTDRSTAAPSAASTGAAASASRASSGGGAGTPNRAAPSTGGGNGGSGASKIIAIVAVVIAIIALILSGWLFSRGQSRLASLDSRLSTVENGMESNVQDVVMPRLKRFDSRLQSVSGDVAQQSDTLSSLQQSVQQTQTQMADVADKVAGSNNRWDLNQIESLLRAANQRLQLYDDPEGARQALELASDAIRRKNDPRLFDLRGEIVNEIAALDALPNPDVEGMSLTLAAMIEQVPKLPLASNVPGEFQPEGEAAGDKSSQEGGDDSGMSMAQFQAEFSQGWDHFVDSVGEAMSGMFTIRRADGTQRALLPPDQAFFLNQNLQLELRAARLALLERDTQNYRDSLANARQWLEDYYDTGAAPVSNMAERLDQMSNVKLDWDAPDITASLVNLREMMSQRTGSASAGNGAQANEQNTSDGEAAAQDGQ